MKRKYVLRLRHGSVIIDDTPGGDLTALNKLYEDTNGANWLNNTGWPIATVADMGDAFGVTVAEFPEGTRVISLDMHIDLGENNLVGEIINVPFQNMKRCERLALKQPENSSQGTPEPRLSGALPPQIGFMEALEWLSLSGQDRVIDLSSGGDNVANHNDLAGGKSFVDQNRFTGQLPPEWGNLSNLEMLELRRQDITGGFPSEWQNMESLIGIFVNDCGLSGEFPSWFNEINMPNVKHINVNSNDLIGGPSGINFPELSQLRFFVNNFTIETPILDKPTDLRVYQGNRNGLTRIPWEIFAEGKNLLLNSFYAGPRNYGLFGQSMPTVEEIGGNPADKNLGVFEIQIDGLGGAIPDWLPQCNLIQCNLGWNDFEGDLPALFHDSNAPIYERLRNLRLNRTHVSGAINGMTGALPQGGFGPQVALVSLSLNNFTGDVPWQWGVNTTSTRDIQFGLEQNNITGYAINGDTGYGAISPIVVDGSGNYVSGLHFTDFNIRDNNLSQTAVDNILIDAWNNVNSGLGTSYSRSGVSGRSINVSGNVAPSGDSEVQSAITNLQSNGWAVIHD